MTAKATAMKKSVPPSDKKGKKQVRIHGLPPALVSRVSTDHHHVSADQYVSNTCPSLIYTGRGGNRAAAGRDGAAA